MARTVRVRRADAELRLPVEVGDYTDFLRLDRPRPERRPAVPSERSAAAELPASAGCLSGRSSSLVVSGAPVTPALRPAAHRGRRAAVVRADAAARRRGGAGRYVGAGNRRGRPIRLDDAERHVAGLCLVNDWSARDLQAWEAQPLGPFLSKSFATSLSRWLVTLDALAPFRCPAARPADDPPPLPHLAPGERRRRRYRRHGGGLTRERRDAPRGLAPLRLSRAGFRDMYWTLAQMVAHHASNGCSLRTGDLPASRTISGPRDDAAGCLLERTGTGAMADRSHLPVTPSTSWVCAVETRRRR